MMRAPQPPVFLFLIDVSAPAVQSGFLQEAIRGIKEGLQGICVRFL